MEINVAEIQKSVAKFNALHEDVMMLKAEAESVPRWKSNAWDMLDELRSDVKRKLWEVSRIGTESQGTALVGYRPQLCDLGSGFVLSNPTRLREMKAVEEYINQRIQEIDGHIDQAASFHDCVLSVTI